MSEINVQLVREFFELHQFHVLTHWPHEADTARSSDAGSLIFIEHTSPETRDAPEFLLRIEEVPLLHRAVVEVRAWHGDRFYPSVVENNAVLAHVAGREVQALARGVFGNPEFATILVISELPQSHAPRQRALQLLQGLGIDHILEFPTLLQGILQRISPHAGYAPSQTLQMLRLLKRYNFIRRQQLEFSFPVDPTPLPTAPAVDVAIPLDDEDAADD